MLIGIDAGNTNITVGLFPEDTERIEPLFAWRFNTKADETGDELAAPILAHLLYKKIEPTSIRHAIVSSVVPALDFPLRSMLAQTMAVEQPVFVDHNTDSGLSYAYPNPAEIGADRIVNAAAAIVLYGPPLLIIDFGTATTFCCVSADGAYLGGQILPGVGLSLRALTERAAKLPAAPLLHPAAPLANNTQDSISAGIYYQTLGAVEKIIPLLRAEIGGQPTVVATGGYAALFTRQLPVIDVLDTDLTLKGLRLIHNRLRS